MTYLAWYDDDRKKPASAKIDEAAQRFIEKYGRVPNLCLVSEGERIEHEKLVVKPAHRLRRNTFWITYDERLSSRVTKQ